MDVFATAFQLSTEGFVSFSELPSKAVADMKALFSGNGVPLRPPNKKEDMKVEYRLLHDIVAKSLCAKDSSFDLVTSKKQVISGFAVPLSILLERLVKAELGESVVLHPLKVLNNRSVLTYMKKNQVVAQSGESSKAPGDTASENKFTDDDTGNQLATHFLPKIDPAAKGKKIQEAFARQNPVEKNFLLVIQAA
ncbi:UDP-glucose 6-dehydrogenase [Dorcoceras hygrometricum]|uniref:UDP-glucose 6-dehydrogenase n=1 Tax=Dorcoceras hygrometricum TaxID=472368 RepID=A0A2Z7D5M2_9LAMI|nr:UDP-glucose 6-dehydrogenase [Dorcoceras hygrometricum]